MHRETRPGRADRLLLLEAVLALVLFALFILLYIQPVGMGSLTPRWWAAPVLGALFFGILLLEARRRKRNGKDALSRGMRDDGISLPEDDQP